MQHSHAAINVEYFVLFVKIDCRIILMKFELRHV